jgi:hypothetical protein
VFLILAAGEQREGRGSIGIDAFGAEHLAHLSKPVHGIAGEGERLREFFDFGIELTEVLDGADHQRISWDAVHSRRHLGERHGAEDGHRSARNAQHHSAKHHVRRPFSTETENVSTPSK